MSSTFIDDRDPVVTFSPRTAWSRQLICDECRGVEGGGAFVGQVAAAARGGTWTTALGNNPTSNVTIRFRGMGVQAHFILFTRVQGVSNEDLPAENMAQISFFINGTLFDPAPIAFRHWWNPDVPQQPFIENVILLAQQGLSPGTHDLTIQYAIDTTLGLPQVLLAFDSLEVTPFQDAPGTPATRLSPSSSKVLPSSSLRPTGGSNNLGSPGGLTERAVGISLGIVLFLAIIASFFGALWSSRRKERKRQDQFVDVRNQASPFSPFSPITPWEKQGSAMRHYRAPDSTDINKPLTEITPFIANSNSSPQRKISTTSSFGNSGPLPRSPAPPVPRLPKALRSPAPLTPAPERPLPPIPDGSPASSTKTLAARPIVAPLFYQPKRKLDVPVVDHGDYYTIASMSDTRTSGISFEPRETKDGRYFRPHPYRDESS
ncbi:hypothetical protein BKA70DRAFT_1435730 [Coprinopsis sp. MPI-PUGE-AT-0042]|nr:hypothetical protein BKA70DRAFT_1435730 [Coprinopsis sp. MPI-PUGE-AT-0042]